MCQERKYMTCWGRKSNNTCFGFSWLIYATTPGPSQKSPDSAMPYRMASLISWMTKSGSTRKTMRLMAKEHWHRALSQHLAPQQGLPVKCKGERQGAWHCAAYRHLWGWVWTFDGSVWEGDKQEDQVLTPHKSSPTCSHVYSTDNLPLQGLEQDSPFPPFSNYYNTFSNKLTPNMIAMFTVPSWILQPQSLLHFANVIYSYWKEHRIEWDGHRIIPTLNVSLMHYPISLHLTHCHSNMTSWISKISHTFASGGMMSRQCTRPVPWKHLLLKSFFVWRVSSRLPWSLLPVFSSASNWNARRRNKQMWYGRNTRISPVLSASSLHYSMQEDNALFYNKVRVVMPTEPMNVYSHCWQVFELIDWIAILYGSG